MIKKCSCVKHPKITTLNGFCYLCYEEERLEEVYE